MNLWNWSSKCPPSSNTLDGAFLLEYIRILSRAVAAVAVVVFTFSVVDFVGSVAGVVEEDAVSETMLHKSKLKYIPGLSKGLDGENFDLCGVSPRSSIHAIRGEGDEEEECVSVAVRRVKTVRR